MKWRHLKIVGLMVLIGAIVCAATYAGKNMVSLPAAVKAAIEKAYPGAEIEEAELEKEGIELYEVELEQPNGREVEVTVAPDGTIVEIETEVAVDSLPPAVAKAIAQVGGGAEIKEAEKEVTYAVVRLVKLDVPQTTYEAELVKDGKTSEIEVAEDGTVLELKAKDDDD